MHFPFQLRSITSSCPSGAFFRYSHFWLLYGFRIGSDRQMRSMIESLVWNSGDDEEAMNKLLMSYKGEIMMAIDSVDSVDLSENERELMFKYISTIIKQDRIRVRPQNQKAV